MDRALAKAEVRMAAQQTQQQLLGEATVGLNISPPYPMYCMVGIMRKNPLVNSSL